jgi:hypothetical protein
VAAALRFEAPPGARNGTAADGSRSILLMGMAAYGLGIGANIDDPIKDRELFAMVWMTALHRLIAHRPFAQMVEG